MRQVTSPSTTLAMMQRVLLSTRRLTYRHGYRSLSTFSRSLAPISSSLSAFQRPHSFAVRSLSLVGEHSLISTQRHHFSSGSDGQPLGKVRVVASSVSPVLLLHTSRVVILYTKYSEYTHICTRLQYAHTTYTYTRHAYTLPRLSTYTCECID